MVVVVVVVVDGGSGALILSLDRCQGYNFAFSFNHLHINYLRWVRIVSTDFILIKGNWGAVRVEVTKIDTGHRRL